MKKFKIKLDIICSQNKSFTHEIETEAEISIDAFKAARQEIYEVYKDAKIIEQRIISCEFI